jgi:hypothetical protein
MAKVHYSNRFIAGLLAALLSLLLTGTLRARDIQSGEPSTITGALSLAKDGALYITSNDIVIYNGAKFPVTRVPVTPYLEEAKDAHYKELKHLAAAGKTVTVRGEFHRLHGQGPDRWGSPIILNLLQ